MEIATVHGVAYEWSTFEPMDNAIIEVNSTPSQSMVAKYGVYSFELPNGSYKITASYYEDGQLTYYAEDTIVTSDEGSYVLDLLLLPSYSDSNDTGADGNATIVSTGSLLAGGLLVIVLLLLVLAVQIMKKPKPAGHRNVKLEASPYMPGNETKRSSLPIREEPDEVPDESAGVNDAEVTKTVEEFVDKPESLEEFIDEPVEELAAESAEPVIAEDVVTPSDVKIHSDEPVPADLQEILDILRSQGGRMTQKDMRKRLKYSEGKVSLMLLDLEKRGKIQKFKKGRGNVLFLVEEEE